MIRTASRDDWKSISEISKRSGYVDYINKIGPSFMDTGEVLLYEEDDVQAFAKLEYLQDNSAWFSGLRVDPEYWRKGVGTILTKATIERARQQGSQQFRALVFEDNFRSLKLFRNLGCQEIKTYDFFLGLPDLGTFQTHPTNITGYVDIDWAFTRFTDEKPLVVDLYYDENWTLVKTTDSTVQVLQRGEGQLKLDNLDGFTSMERVGNRLNENIFEEETEKSTGILLEMPLI